jgi:hypothetical protein
VSREFQANRHPCGKRRTPSEAYHRCRVCAWRRDRRCSSPFGSWWCRGVLRLPIPDLTFGKRCICRGSSHRHCSFQGCGRTARAGAGGRPWRSRISGSPRRGGHGQFDHEHLRETLECWIDSECCSVVADTHRGDRRLLPMCRRWANEHHAQGLPTSTASCASERDSPACALAVVIKTQVAETQPRCGAPHTFACVALVLMALDS